MAEQQLGVQRVACLGAVEAKYLHRSPPLLDENRLGRPLRRSVRHQVTTFLFVAGDRLGRVTGSAQYGRTRLRFGHAVIECPRFSTLNRTPLRRHSDTWQALTTPRPVLFTEVTGRVGTITLNRPARRNALNGELIGALDAAVRHMADDPEVKVVVLTGAAPEGGTGGFCSGGDVKDGARGPGGEKGVPVDALSGDLSRHDLHAAMLLHVMPKPTIAMVGGPAVGAGCSLAAACDLRFAVRGCRLLGELLAQRPVGRLRGFRLLDPHRRDGAGPAPLPPEREDHRAKGVGTGHGARGTPTGGAQRLHLRCRRDVGADPGHVAGSGQGQSQRRRGRGGAAALALRPRGREPVDVGQGHSAGRAPEDPPAT